MKKRLLSMLLTASMVVSVLPVMASATFSSTASCGYCGHGASDHYQDYGTPHKSLTDDEDNVKFCLTCNNSGDSRGCRNKTWGDCISHTHSWEYFKETEKEQDVIRAYCRKGTGQQHTADIVFKYSSGSKTNASIPDNGEIPYTGNKVQLTAAWDPTFETVSGTDNSTKLPTLLNTFLYKTGDSPLSMNLPTAIGEYTSTFTVTYNGSNFLIATRDFSIVGAVEATLDPATITQGSTQDVTLTATHKPGSSGLLKDNHTVNVYGGGMNFTGVDLSSGSAQLSGDQLKTLPAGDYTICIQKVVEVGLLPTANVQPRKLLLGGGGTPTPHDYEANCLAHVTLTVNPAPDDGGAPAPTYSAISEVDVDTANGSVSFSRKNAAAGSKVTITVKPDEGYVLDEIVVLNSKGNEVKLTKVAENKYQFEMPKGGVTVDAEFVEGEPAVVEPEVEPETEPETETTLPGDVDPGEWYAASVSYVLENGIMAGTSHGFEPNTKLNRAMAAQLMFNLSGATGSYTNSYGDVDNDWYTNAVGWNESMKIMLGNNGNFNPNAVISREQFAQTLFAYAQAMGFEITVGDADLSGFHDAASVSDWAVAAMKWAVENGLIAGNRNNLNPQGPLTRAEAARILEVFHATYIAA